MDYPFSKKDYDKGVYFNKKEKAHIEEFIANLPQVSLIFENPDGEKRHLQYMKLPRGCITRLTAKCPVEGYGDFYHTPTAKHDEPFAVMYWQNPNDPKDNGSCNSMEWLEWEAGAVTISEPPPPVTRGNAGRLAAMKSKEGTRAKKEKKGGKSKWVNAKGKEDK